MTDRTEAMDNLIAQDADLIDTNDKDSAVLLPCPFCGGVQIEAFHHIDRGWGASWHVECVAEECGNSTCHHDTEATAIAAWNKRQPTQSDALHMDAADRIEQLEREKAVVSDLWEQQKEIALDYLTDCNKAAERIEALEVEIEQWKVDYNELLLEAAKLRAALKNHLYTGEGWRPFKEIYEALREKNDG
jgi:hypothetical protein